MCNFPPFHIPGRCPERQPTFPDFSEVFMPLVTKQPQPQEEPKPLLFVYVHGHFQPVPNMAEANRVATEQAAIHAAQPGHDVHILRSVAVVRPPTIPLERVDFGPDQP